LNPMKYKSFRLFYLVTILFVICACQQKVSQKIGNVRPLADTVGFAQYDWQMDSIMKRIERFQSDSLGMSVNVTMAEAGCKVIISPHDDYSYVGYLYPKALRMIKAKTIIMFGVAHKAKLMNLEDQIVFESYSYWKGPYGHVKVSEAREKLLGYLPPDIFQLNDSMHRIEHSLEALIPFLQYFNRNIEIIPILVPYMSFTRMDEISEPLAKAILTLAKDRKWKWGTDYSIIISTDAVHYGDQDWGDKNFAWFGTDNVGYLSAVAHEYEIIETLSGKLDPEKLESFCKLTVQDTNFREYKWTWCGRYSVPFGLLTAFHLNRMMEGNTIFGNLVGYSTSINHLPIPVKDLGMGITAPANNHHWVGYASLVYY
jgi:MEMO1 family protein